MLKNNTPATPTLYGEDAKAVMEELEKEIDPGTKEKGKRLVAYFSNLMQEVIEEDKVLESRGLFWNKVLNNMVQNKSELLHKKNKMINLNILTIGGKAHLFYDSGNYGSELDFEEVKFRLKCEKEDLEEE